MTQSANKLPGRSQILADAMADCLWTSGDEVQHAANLLTVKLMNDRELLAAFEDHLFVAAYTLLTQHVRNDRARIMARLRLVQDNEIGGGQKTEADSGQTASAAGNEGLMYFPIYGGKRIKDATAAEIRTSGEFYLRQGRTMVASGRWQIMVAKRLDAGEAITESLLRELYAQARSTDV